MKKVLILLGLSSLLLTSCKSSSMQVFSSQNIDVSPPKEISEVFLEKDSEARFVYEPILNKSVYTEKKDNMDIEVSVPDTKSDKVNKMILEWAEDDIESIKNKYKTPIQEGNDFKYVLDFEVVNLSDEIVNIKYTGEIEIDASQRRVFKTNFYNLDKETEIKFNYASEESRKELKMMAVNSKELFNEGKVASKLDKKSFEGALDAEPKNYQTFYINEDTKELILVFDEEQLGKINQEHLIAISVPLRFLSKTFKEEASDIYELYKHTFDTSKKYVSLTFDDGPHAANTEKLLDGLKELNVKATFFLVGYSIENYPQTVLRMSQEGHEIGNHSFGHADLTKLSVDDIIYQIQSANRMISEITGNPVKLLRPPYGAHDDRVDKVAKDLGMSMVFWNVDPLDWKYKDSLSVYKNIINAAKDGDIILLHDLQSSSVEAALNLIPVMQEQGYEFVTASELLEKNSKLIAGEGYYYGKISR